MENKTTIELLDILWKVNKKEEPTDKEWDNYTDALAELEKRPPFNKIIGENEFQNEFTHEERLEKLEEDIKLLKRHKHDDKSGDVLVRI